MEFGENFDFYNNSQGMAINFQFTETQKKAKPTITLELANLPADGAKFEWAGKISLQLTEQELKTVTKALLGWETEAKGSHHGTEKNKSFTVKLNQDPEKNFPLKSVFIGLIKAGEKKSILLSPEVRTELVAIFLRRIAEGWKMSVSDTLNVLRVTL